MSKHILVIKLEATNDINGNPRRIFIIFDEESNIIETIDEGYSGDRELNKKYPNLPSYCTFKTTIKEYRNLLKWGKK